jgi:pseudouridine-5'-phosphate glycosidase
MNECLSIGDDVQRALAAKQPVVALESTIISHGMPYPQNRDTALRVEATVRENGATPATIAIMDGRLCVGLSPDQIEQLAVRGQQARKISRRDMAFAVTDRTVTGATTVASTMIIAAMAGIRVFATGGIGGVHRGAEHTMDISADLQELAQTSVAVVCAGAKSILDIALTREYLETHGVPVIGYGTDCWPAFYTRSSDFDVDYRLDDPAAVARALAAKWQLGLGGGALVCVPVPTEFSMDAAVIDAAIGSALHEADQQGIVGKEVTPFLLARIAEITGGESLAANIELVLNNAKTAAQIAVALSPG